MDTITIPLTYMPWRCSRKSAESSAYAVPQLSPAVNFGEAQRLLCTVHSRMNSPTDSMSPRRLQDRFVTERAFLHLRGGSAGFIPGGAAGAVGLSRERDAARAADRIILASSRQAGHA